MDDVFYVVEGYYSFEDYLNYMDSHPITERGWELVEGRFHSGPGLATVMDLDPLNPEADKKYFEELEFYSERGCPWLVHNYFDHYNPAEWNEANDSLVRTLKERKKSPPDYSQLLLGIPLV